jgi:hypothetical protein
VSPFPRHPKGVRGSVEEEAEVKDKEEGKEE